MRQWWLLSAAMHDQLIAYSSLARSFMRSERTTILGCGRATLVTARAAENDAWSFNRVGNAPRVERRGKLFRHSTRGALPTRLNEA